ncbi:TIGR03747 family integrating conjugative element membrane protein [Aliikangiella maris]|uniref:TIGR03747 family integrating conjugative element membrane protein n=2 Tax=Aliikangiella maris TaxID=3162458 RepID=A0ABV3MTS2_9GAMM
MSRERETRQASTTNNVIGFLFNTVFLIIVSLFLSIVVEWLGLSFGWWEFGSEHSLDMIKRELSYSNDNLRKEFYYTDGGGWTSNILRYYMLGMHALFYWCSQIANYVFDNPELIVVYMESGYNISVVFGLRILLVVYSIPLFVMVFLWAFVDGLTERDLRRFGAGRESSTIFEASRRMLFPLLIIPFLIYLSFPTSVNPMLIIAPSAIIQAFLYRVLFSKYKKYL